MFTEHIGFEIGVNYLFGQSSEIRQEFRDTQSTENHVMKVSSRSVNITPSLRLAIPLGKKISLYSRSGLVIPVVSRATKNQESVYAENGSSVGVSIKSIVKNRFGLGYAGALGVALRASDNITLNLEIAGQMLSLWADREKIESFKIDGKTYDPKQFNYSEETIYVRESPVARKKGYALTYQSPFHSLGINVGLAFSL